MQEKKRRPDRRVYVCMYVCMYVGKATRAPRRGVLCIYVLQEPMDGKHDTLKARLCMYACMYVCMHVHTSMGIAGRGTNADGATTLR